MKKEFRNSGITLQQLTRITFCPIEIHFFNEELGKRYNINLFETIGACAIDDDHLAKPVVRIESTYVGGIEIWVGDEWIRYAESKTDREEEDDEYLL